MAQKKKAFLEVSERELPPVIAAIRKIIAYARSLGFKQDPDYEFILEMIAGFEYLDTQVQEQAVPMEDVEQPIHEVQI